MLSQPKSAVHQQAAFYLNNTDSTSKGIMTSILPLKKADRLLKQKHTGSQFHYIAPLTLYANLFFLFSGHEPIYFIENKEKTLRASYDRGTQIVDYMD